MMLLDGVDAAAAAIGAVNTVVAVGEAKFEGRNTDAPGFLASLRAHRAIRAERPAALLGAGGAARAILAALSSAGIREIRIANRNRSRAEMLAARFPCVVVDWDDRGPMLEGVGLLINSTSLGMTGEPPLDIDLARLPVSATVTDIVYRPLETALLAAARQRGNLVVDGVGMLLHQAVEGFHAWFGVVPRVTPALRAHVLAAIQHGA
jgi:shikimate dehydrogenase